MEHKELLIKDLCPRLPYGLVIDYNGIRTTLHDIKVFQLYEGNNIKDYICLIDIFGDDDYVDVENIKPYLFPMSSMTEEQREEFALLQTSAGKEGFLYAWNCTTMMKWLLENHFDYNCLIEKGLAINATNKNIY